VRPEVENIKVDADRASAEASEIGCHTKSIVQSRWVLEIASKVNPWEPDIEPVENLTVGETGSAKELRLGDLEESHI
jgi:hypothetical protein